MKLLTVATVVFCLLATSELTQAQVPGDYQAARNASSGLSNLFGGGNGSGGGLGNLMQAFNMSRSPGIEPSQQSGGFGGLQNLQGLQGLIPALGGAGQNTNTGTDILSRMNQKSKSMIDRTTGWARQKKQEMSQKMMGNALGSLIPSLKPQQSNQAKSAFDWLKPKSYQPPNQPPLRSAQNYEQQPGIRY